MIIASVIMRKANNSQGNGSTLDTVHICSLVEGTHEVEYLFYWLCGLLQYSTIIVSFHFLLLIHVYF